MTERRPAHCRFRLQDEGKAYPRSGCTACGRTILTGLGNECQGLPAASEVMVSLFEVAEEVFRHAEKMDALGKPNAAAACRLLAMTFEDKARKGGAVAPPSTERLAEHFYQKRRADRAEADLVRAREALRIFYGCAYPVSTEINPRGWNWRGESALDEALSFTRAALDDRPDKAVDE